MSFTPEKGGEYINRHRNDKEGRFVSDRGPNDEDVVRRQAEADKTRESEKEEAIRKAIEIHETAISRLKAELAEISGGSKEKPFNNQDSDAGKAFGGKNVARGKAHDPAGLLRGRRDIYQKWD